MSGRPKTTGDAIRQAVRKASGRIAIRSEHDGTVYAYQCAGCGAAWKIYQQPSHYAGCGPRLVDLRKLRKGRRVRHARHGLGTVLSIRRERKTNGAQKGTVDVLFDLEGVKRMWLRETAVDAGTALGRKRSGAWWSEPGAMLEKP